VSSYIGEFNHVDIAVTNASTNAGHTFYVGDNKYVTKHLPVTGILNKRSTIYLCPGAIIEPNFLLKELSALNIKVERVCIHPRVAIIEPNDIEYEQNGPVKRIASTRSGVGSALARKINRDSGLAQSHPLLKPMIKALDLNFYLEQGCEIVMEVPQGFDLSINSGLSYPHCTSREITVAQALSDAQVHPKFLGEVIVVLRTFPIRVGHIVENGKVVGDSGPFYEDSKEVSWEHIGVLPEFTTNTKRKRRVATFSRKQYKKMLSAFRPDKIFLNFANYLSRTELDSMLSSMPEVTHVCYGPKIEDVKEVR
jgi:adenylosuccinate synthase